MYKPIILKIVSNTEARAYCPQCKRFVAVLNDSTKASFPKECPHCKEPLTLSMMKTPDKNEELID